MPQYLEVEYIATRGGNGLAVDDEWVYYQSPTIAGAATFRLPKVVGTEATPEFVGPYNSDGSGALIKTDGDDVAWATASLTGGDAKVYIYRKASGTLDEADLGFNAMLGTAHLTSQHVVVFINNCLGGAAVNRQTLEVTGFSRTSDKPRGGRHFSTVFEDMAYCSDDYQLFRVPLSGGELERVAETETYLGDMTPWSDGFLLYVSGGRSESGLVDMRSDPIRLTNLAPMVVSFDSRAEFSLDHQAVYWLSRYPATNKLVLYETQTWNSMSLALPPDRAPSDGTAQDDEYLYWTERVAEDGNKIVRTKKLTYAEAAKKYFGVDWTPDADTLSELEAKIEAATRADAGTE